MALLACLAALAACAPQKPVSYNAPPAAQPHDGRPRVTVRSGDTVYMIARANNVSLRRLIEVNGLEPPYLIHPGESLVLPPPPVHVVQRGETLYGISRQYRIDVYSLAQANNIGPPYTLRIGDQLRVPDAYATQPGTVAASGGEEPAPVQVAPVQQAQPLPPAQQSAAQPPAQQPQTAPSGAPQRTPAGTPAPSGSPRP
ncbi:MAG: LysM peptidoglycan-binding domain-containing protein, partial [Alphaproteobacteria bacterium]|nr:LysM peptidoglycan-binding domain-containing protein [Alphaproteobacteria bacterium]